MEKEILNREVVIRDLESHYSRLKGELQSGETRFPEFLALMSEHWKRWLKEHNKRMREKDMLNSQRKPVSLSSSG